MAQDAAPRVLALSGHDSANGAGVAAATLHRALLGLGVPSRLLVRHVGDPESRAEPLSRSRAGRWVHFHRERLGRRSGLLEALQPATPGREFDAALRASDVLHVHALQSVGVNPGALVRWSQRLPVAWTLHDAWALSGKCIQPGSCERWLSGCGECPQVGEWPPADRDRTAFLWRWKRRLWASARVRLVAPSRWLAGLARRSPLTSHLRVDVLPYAIDERTFRPGDRRAARAELGIAPDVGVVAFASHPGVPRKGFPDLLAATQDRRAAGRVVVLALGDAGAAAAELPGVVWAGRTDDRAALAARLRAADVVCLPTRGDNLPLALLEAAATGLPAVAYDVGGCAEAVLHGETGLVVPPQDVAGLRAALDSLLDDPARARALGGAGRLRVEAEFAAPRVAARHLQLYSSLREEWEGGSGG